MVTDDKEQPVESHRLFELGEYVRMKTNDLTQGSIWERICAVCDTAISGKPVSTIV